MITGEMRINPINKGSVNSVQKVVRLIVKGQRTPSGKTTSSSLTHDCPYHTFWPKQSYTKIGDEKTPRGEFAKYYIHWVQDHKTSNF